MRNFIKEYLKILAYAAIGFVFVLSSFYLVMNYYHSEEIKRTIFITPNNLASLNYSTKLEKIRENLKTYSSKKSTNVAYKTMYNKLLTCQTILSSEGTIANMPVNTNFTSHDIYKLGIRFQNDVLNLCWAMHLSYLNSEEVPKEFASVAPYITKSINFITNQTNVALRELQNNSSYFYSTNITSSTIRNYLSTDYTLIVNSYNDFADIILNLSEMIIQDNDGGNIND